MKNIAFIINPISGTRNKKQLPKIIEKELDREQWLHNIVFTEYPGHATILAQQFARMGFDAVVSCGGDGTLNEVARGLAGTNTALGVMPMGSGNGFARHIGMPMQPANVIRLFNHSEAVLCDYGMAEDKLFISTCGTGFDATIAEHFAQVGKRGFIGYLQSILKDAFAYKPEHCRLVGKDIDMDFHSTLVNFANASQWGYEAAIAPKASIQDGRLDISIMSSKALLAAPELAVRLFTHSIDDSLFMDTLRVKEVTLIRDAPAPFHIDGDPVEMPKDVHIRVVEDGIRVLVEKRF